MKLKTAINHIVLWTFLLIPFIQVTAQDFSFTCDSLVQRGELGGENLFIALLTNNTDASNHIRLELNDEHLPDVWNYFWCVDQSCLPPNTYSFDDILGANVTDSVFLHIFPEDMEGTGDITITAVPLTNPTPQQSLTFRVHFGNAVDDPYSQSAPDVYSVVRAYPNPFNPSATVSYTLDRAGYTEVIVIDLLGQPIRNLFQGWQTAGIHNLTWDGTDTRGVNMPGGIYLVAVENGSKSHVIRLVKLE